MKIERIESYGWEAGLRGMRNPMNSWDKSDTIFDEKGIPTIGPNDLKLATNLIKAGPEHGKWARQVFVSMDITAPLYWWKELDTYKVGTTANSQSTMHKLASTPITIDCFETDDIVEDLTFNGCTPVSVVWEDLINACEALRKAYNETKDIRYWKELVRILPEGWLQTRTWTANYAVLRAMYHQRKNHKLVEWETFLTELIDNLPYSKEFIVDN
jgi:hypothetical protein